MIFKTIECDAKQNVDEKTVLNIVIGTSDVILVMFWWIFKSCIDGLGFSVYLKGSLYKKNCCSVFQSDITDETKFICFP